MADGRDLRELGWTEEPSEQQLAERLRRWVIHYRDLFRSKERTQADLAEALGLSQATISNIVNEKEVPGLKTLIRLHFRLGAPLDELVRSDPLPITQTQVGARTQVRAGKRARGA